MTSTSAHVGDQNDSSSSEGRIKPLIVKNIFGSDRHFGSFPSSVHCDLRTMIEVFRREALQKHANKRRRTRPLEEHRRAVVEEVLQRSDMSLEKIRDQVIGWYDEQHEAFDADQYYDERRAKAYTRVNQGSQKNLGNRCATLANVRRGDMVLDMGCGSGLSMEAAKNAGAGFVIGFDLSSGMLGLVPREVGDVIRLDLRQKLPFREGIFDSVVSVGAVHFLEEYPASLRQLFAEVSRTSSPTARFCAQLFPSKAVAAPTAEDEVKAFQPYFDAIPRVGDSDPRHALVFDHAHHTDKRRCFLVVNNSGEAPTRQHCMVFEGQASCVLQGVLQGTPLEADEHYRWVTDEHCKFARNLMRKVMRGGNAGVHSDDAGPCIVSLRKLFNCEQEDAEVPSLQDVKARSNEVIAVLHFLKKRTTKNSTSFV